MIILEFIYVLSMLAILIQTFIKIKKMKDVYIRDILEWLVVLLLAMTPVLNTLVFVTLLYTSLEGRQFLNIKLR